MADSFGIDCTAPAPPATAAPAAMAVTGSPSAAAASVSSSTSDAGILEGTASAPLVSVAVSPSASAVVAAVPECDWTYSNDYVCTLSSISATAAAAPAGVPATPARNSPSLTAGATGTVLRARELPTFSSDPELAAEVKVEGFRSVESPAAAVTTSAAAATEKQQEGRWSIQCCASGGIDYELLKRQDEPILFYDEFLFYQVRLFNIYLQALDIIVVYSTVL